MLLRRLYLVLLALMLSTAGGSATAGTTYTFNGGAVAGCSVAGAAYTCASLPLASNDDDMVIASGFRVNIASDATFGNNQGLTMSGSAVLASTGDLDIGGIKSNNLAITGGTLIAGNTFSTGSQTQTLTANIQAANANLDAGSGLTITGNITVTGNVSLAGHTSVHGAISAATVDASPGAEIHGNVVATTSFSLGSHGQVVGDITAPVVTLQSAQSQVTGNITAKVSLELGSQVNVTGDVVAGTLTMNPAKAIIDGNATVDSAVLGSQDRVTQFITCTGGTRPGQCDCVQNNSGYDINTTEGPHCQRNQVPLDHIMIGYDPAGSVCAPSTVTLTACANAACTSTYGAGVSVKLTPTGQTVDIGGSGVAQASVNYTQAGINTLGVTGVSTAGATTCVVNGTGAAGANCQVNVARSAYTMSLGTATGYTSESAQTLTIAALRFDDASRSCVPMFNGTTRNATFSCAYVNPSTGYVPVRLNGVALNPTNQATATCGGGSPSISLSFDANGKATLPLLYADAGQVQVTITDNGSGSPGTASVTPTFVPARFTVALNLGTPPLLAGADFTVAVTALNAGNGATRNFGRETAPEKPLLRAVPCLPSSTTALLSQDASPALGGGVYTFSNVEWSDVGSIDLQAALTSNSYLGTGKAPTPGTTNIAPAGCTGAAGMFIPAYFTVEPDPGWQRKATLAGAQWLQYYSGEPAIQLKVTARTVQNGVPQSYAGTLARDVAFSAIAPVAPGIAVSGTFAPAYAVSASTATAQVRATDFAAGAATWTGSFTFANSLMAQTRMRMRATEIGQGLAYPVSSSAIPPGGTVPAEPTLLLRIGRIRLSNAFGGIGRLTLPVALEYYTGQTWVRNSEDTTTQIGPGAAAVSTGTTLGTVAVGLTNFTNGAATLSLTPSSTQRGSIPVAINLGSTSGANTSCYYNAATANMTASTGAALAFLRSTDPSCNRTGADPSAMATFGVYAPETKRVIHVREVVQ
ncbi:MAG: polymer-forming cytoskeletal protein [Massilia sp.]|nr:polymer-forming cytoskeletal protein [Massilia sp.]